MDKDSHFYLSSNSGEKWKILVEEWRWTVESAITIVSLNSNKGGQWRTQRDQKSNLVRHCEAVNYFPQSMNITGGPVSSTNIYKSRPADKPTNFIFLTLKLNCHPAFVSLYFIRSFQSKIFLCWCFAESSHRLKYCINPLILKQQYFLGLCKFYSSGSQNYAK